MIQGESHIRGTRRKGRYADENKDGGAATVITPTGGQRRSRYWFGVIGQLGRCARKGAVVGNVGVSDSMAPWFVGGWAPA